MKTSGVLLPRASLIGVAPRYVVSSWKSMVTLMPVSMVNSGNSGVIAFDHGWIAPESAIVCPANCFQSIAALAWIAAASSAKLHRGSTLRAGSTAPAAPNPLTKLRRLAGIRRFREFSPCAMLMLLDQGSHSQHASGAAPCDIVALARRLTGSEAGVTWSGSRLTHAGLSMLSS